MDTLGTSSRSRPPLLALGIFALVAALWGGLIRIGWEFPPIAPAITGIHGPLMVSGFLGTLIGMERAVALRARWPFAAPIFTASGALILITGVSPLSGSLLITLGSVGMVAIFVVIVRRQPALFTYTMMLGAFAWLIGNVLWLAGLPVFRIVLWWSAFLILTIVGERLELSRLLRLTPFVERLYLGAVILLGMGLAIDAAEGIADSGTVIGTRVAGAAMLALALWLVRYDIIRRTVRQTGLTRFIALSLGLGYLWLGTSGLMRLFSPDVSSTNMYDATLHSVFLGFVMSMIFGHAAIILPAVLGRAMDYRPTFYAHLGLLHLSLLMRILGDLAAEPICRQWGGMLNAIAILLFLFTTVRSILSAARASRTFAATQAPNSI